MKNLLFLIFLFSNGISYSQTYTIANWLDNKSSATVLTFDDWDPASPGSTAPTMIQKGLAGTFFVTINNAWRSTDYPTMTNAAANGLEIANHTMSHPHLPAVANFAYEIENCRTTLNANVTQALPVHTFAYPYGEYDASIITEIKKHHIGARTVDNSTNSWGYNYPSTDDEYFKIPTVQVGTFGTLQNFINGLETAITAGGLYTIMYHSVGGLGWYDDITQSLFEQQLDEVKARANRTWVTTFSNAVRYHKEKHCATLSMVGNNLTTWKLSLTDTLSNNTIFSHPLTINLTTPGSETYSSIQQNGTSLSFSSSPGKLTFNAIPDGGEILITKGVPTTIVEELVYPITVYPVPSSDYISIKTPKDVLVRSVEILTMQGKRIYFKPDEVHENRIDISSLPAGIYILEITTNLSEKHIRKISKN